MNKAYKLALEDLGTWEWRQGHNPKVVQYFKDVGHGWVTDDETAWCAAFVGAMLKRAGYAHTGKLNARSYLDWGEPVDLDEASVGDIVVFWRVSPSDWRGHVAFLAEEYNGGSVVSVLGGNQANQVNIRDYSTNRILGVRKPPNTVEPSNPENITNVEPNFGRLENILEEALDIVRGNV